MPGSNAVRVWLRVLNMPNQHHFVDAQSAYRLCCQCCCEDPACEVRSVSSSSKCGGARHRASVFSFGVTALYVRNEGCQRKYQNVLASAALADSRHVHTLKYAKLGSRTLIFEKLA